MPGGIGPVSESTLSAGSGRDRAIGTVKNANEIFFHLHARRVYVDRGGGSLYFVDSAQSPVRQTILAAMAGMQETVAIEQLHLDTHRFFTGACRVALSRRQVEGVLVALRLAGVAATVA